MGGRQIDRGGLGFKARRLLCLSTLGSTVINKIKKGWVADSGDRDIGKAGRAHRRALHRGRDAEGRYKAAWKRELILS